MKKLMGTTVKTFLFTLHAPINSEALNPKGDTQHIGVCKNTGHYKKLAKPK
jgi:hypothetical protein